VEAQNDGKPRQTAQRWLTVDRLVPRRTQDNAWRIDQNSEGEQQRFAEADNPEPDRQPGTPEARHGATIVEVDHAVPPHPQRLQVPHANAILIVKLTATSPQRLTKAALVHSFLWVRDR
jgi:hypothetical protein